LTDHGVELVDVYVGPKGVLTGSSRLAQEAEQEAAAAARKQETERKRREVELNRRALEAKMAALRAEYEAEANELERIIDQERDAEARLDRDRAGMAQSRRADGVDQDGPKGEDHA